MANERTLILAKADAVVRGLVGEILSRFERRGYTIVGMKMLIVEPARARKHYAEHEGKSFFEPLVTFITRSPSLVMVIEGPDDTWRIVRAMMGATEGQPRR